MSLETFEQMYALMKASTGDKAAVNFSPNDFARSFVKQPKTGAKTADGSGEDIDADDELPSQNAFQATSATKAG